MTCKHLDGAFLYLRGVDKRAIEWCNHCGAIRYYEKIPYSLAIMPLAWEYPHHYVMSTSKVKDV